jgi:hypothetical protein
LEDLQHFESSGTLVVFGGPTLFEELGDRIVVQDLYRVQVSGFRV